MRFWTPGPAPLASNRPPDPRSGPPPGRRQARRSRPPRSLPPSAPGEGPGAAPVTRRPGPRPPPGRAPPSKTSTDTGPELDDGRKPSSAPLGVSSRCSRRAGAGTSGRGRSAGHQPGRLAIVVTGGGVTRVVTCAAPEDDLRWAVPQAKVPRDPPTAVDDDRAPGADGPACVADGRATRPAGLCQPRQPVPGAAAEPSAVDEGRHRFPARDGDAPRRA